MSHAQVPFNFDRQSPLRPSVEKNKKKQQARRTPKGARAVSQKKGFFLPLSSAVAPFLSTSWLSSATRLAWPLSLVRRVDICSQRTHAHPRTPELDSSQPSNHTRQRRHHLHIECFLIVQNLGFAEIFSIEREDTKSGRFPQPRHRPLFGRFPHSLSLLAIDHIVNVTPAHAPPFRQALICTQLSLARHSSTWLVVKALLSTSRNVLLPHVELLLLLLVSLVAPSWLPPLDLTRPAATRRRRQTPHPRCSP